MNLKLMKKWNKIGETVGRTLQLFGQISKTVFSKRGEDHSSDSLLSPGYHPLGRLPMWFREFDRNRLLITKRGNRYLRYQELRIKNAIVEKKYKKAVLIWLCLLKTSKVYQICLINKVYKDWYRKTTKEQFEAFCIRVMNQCRRFDTRLILRRFYVLKNKEDPKRNGEVYTGELREGEKLRPIGCPTMESRVISRSLTDLTYVVFWDLFIPSQHGCRMHRGVHTVIFDICRYIWENPDFQIYEFDFKSFFNKVSPYWVHQALLQRDEILADVVMKVLVNVGYTWEKIEEEAELKISEGETKSGKSIHILREGLPQGLSLSPLLCTLAVEQFKPPIGTFLYVDDGLFIGDKKGFDEFWRFLNQVMYAGAIVAPEKSGVVKECLKFVGVEINVKNKTVTYPTGLTISWEKDLSILLRTIKKHCSQYYFPESKSKSWEWDIKARSYLDIFGHAENIGWLDGLIVMFVWCWNKGSWKGHRFFPGTGIVDVISSSSVCMSYLLDYSKGFNLKNVKAFTPESFYSAQRTKETGIVKVVNGVKYFDIIYENHLIGYDKALIARNRNKQFHPALIEMEVQRKKKWYWSLVGGNL